jgi:DNA helicase-4
LKETNITLQDLNKDQCKAALSQKKRVLVLAGAGSGKTKTIIQKVLYLIGEKHVDPASILAITFTKNAANEMMDRLILAADIDGKYKNILNDKNVKRSDREYFRREYIKKYPWLSNITVRTFHSLCYNMLRNYGTKEFDNKFKIINDRTYDEDLDANVKAIETPQQIMQKLLKEICEDTNYMLKLKRFILDFYIDVYRVQMNELGHKDYAKPYTTLSGDTVRSKSERYIADWLYIHNIKFVYEPNIQFKDFSFNPDFYIPQADAYLEHVSNLSASMEDKERQFEIGGKKLIKTFETMTKDIRKFHEYLDKNILPLVKTDIKREIALNVEAEFKSYGSELLTFLNNVINVINKVKVVGINFKDVLKKASKDQHDRVRTFYEVAQPLIEAYTLYLVERSYLDFNDLIIRSVHLLKRDKGVRQLYHKKLKYILVDEFQDVNTLQVKLLNYILEKNSQLLCVGDDWQSIYGWRGSEVEYIVNFKRYFKSPQVIKLNVNYRSNDTIVKASNEVIKNNKFKVHKEIHSITESGRKIYLFCSQREKEDGVRAVVEKVQQLRKNGYTKDEILILYRRTSAYEPYKDQLHNMVTARTIHSAKGLEAKIVFIVGLTGGIYGFPQVWESDRIFQVIKESNFELLMEEERRLFYVAITRAREELFLISEVGNESQFIKEIPGEFIDRSNFLILNLQKPQPVICKKCSKEIQLSYNYCPFCGLSINGNDQQVNPTDFHVASKFQVRLDEIKKEFPNAYEPWKEEEEKILKEGFQNGVSIKDLVNELKRQPGAIRARLIKVGLIKP